MSNLNRTSKVKEEGESEDESSDSEDEDEKPELETAVLNHRSGCINRIRVGDYTVTKLFVTVDDFFASSLCTDFTIQTQ